MKTLKYKNLDEVWKDYIVGSDKAKDLELLHFECTKKFEKYNRELINKAFHWCVEGHKNQTRFSGMSYHTHPLEVARIIINELPLDDISVAAALLHDMGDTSKFTINDIRVEFGEEIANIVDGISQIRMIESYEVKQADNFRKLIIAWFNDVRIILIKLADRLHNMRTVEFLPYERQVKLAEETMEIYSPFASRFGLGNFKWELEDISFKILNPEEYSKISSALQFTREERKEYIVGFIEPIRERLNSNEILQSQKINLDIFGRAKHIYSIFNKIIIRAKPMEELFDLFAVRIVLDTDEVSNCYIVLGILSEIYRPVEETFKDYIAEPKKNGYRSIHLAVYGMDHKPVEVQIRTREMHDFAESGFAAHFKYKPGKVTSESILERENFEEWVDMVRGAFENHTNKAYSNTIQTIKTNHLLDDITVFTHTNECKTLPINSTPLDFAYSIHTDIGNTCIGAKVNGKVVPLTYKIKNGDRIEILNSNKQKPVKEWLKIAVSQKARNGILQYFKLERTKYLSSGIEIWENIQNDYSIKLNTDDFNALVRKLKYDNSEEFYVSLGKQDIDLDYIHNYFYHKMKDELRKPEVANDELNDNINEIDMSKINLNMPVIYSECCYPVPGDRIVGEVIDGNEIQIHRRSCKHISFKLNPPQENIIGLKWNWLKKDDYTVRIKIIANKNENVLSDITTLILSYDNIPIRGINFDNDDERFEGYISIAVKSGEQLTELLDSIAKIDGIEVVERVGS